MESVPDLPVYNEMINALQKTGKGKAEKGILGFKGKSMDDFDGTMVGARLDIAAYQIGVYVVTLHDKPQGGEVLSIHKQRCWKTSSSQDHLMQR